MEETNEIIEESTEERIVGIRKKIKICGYISVAAIFLILICLAAEAMVTSFVSDKNIAKNVIVVLSYICNVLPVVVMIPLFVRVNLKTKLSVEIKKKEGN